MRHYLDYHFDIYWDLHLGVKGAIPAEVRQIGESFSTVLAYRNPMQQVVYENYMNVRTLVEPLNNGSTKGSRIQREAAHQIPIRPSLGID
jgi:hypothetical protein